MVVLCAIVGALIAIIPVPGSAFMLIPLEWALLGVIMAKHNAFEFIPFLRIAAVLSGVSAVLKGLAATLQFLPIVGWIGNSLVAFCFILILGTVAERHYSRSTATF